jgi:hypothetical protein
MKLKSHGWAHAERRRGSLKEFYMVKERHLIPFVLAQEPGGVGKQTSGKHEV